MTHIRRVKRETLAAVIVLRRSRRLMRFIATFVAIAFTMLVLAPTAVAAPVVAK